LENKRRKRKPTLKVLPLGGLGEIGKNMMVMEYGREMIIVDCGIMFPDDDLLGIDLILPDYNYVKAKQEKLKGILITHGHEDHIGAIPFLYKEIPHVPIYAPRLAMEFIKSKLDEHKVEYDPNNLVVIHPRANIKVSNHFKAEFIPVNHSISDSFAIAVHTPLGIVLHTGDFKIDYNPIDNTIFDFYKFSELGEKGVALLMSDSTNVEKMYSDKNERDVGVSLAQLVENAKGRVIVATFASNISRIGQLAQIGMQQGRKVAFFGRNMENNLEIARKLEYVKIPDQYLLSHRELKNHPEEKQLIISTGSQGEPMSALSRISQDTHKFIKVKPNDTIILSASVIPGNEKTVSKIINSLFLKGAQVFYQGTQSVHVSGHAPKEHLQLVFRMVRPKFFMPIHGEPRHLIQHANMASEMGWKPEQIILAKNGDMVHLTADGAEIVDRVAQDTVFVDGSMVGDVKKLIRERKTMSEDGVIFAIAGLRILGEEVECMPDVLSKGFFFGDELKDIIEKMKEIINQVILEKFQRTGMDYNALNSSVKRALEKYIQKNFSKRPMIVTRIVEIEN
jgi:ribonuclease J